MSHYMRCLLWLKRLQEGATLIEYALIIFLIAITAIVAIALLGDSVADLFHRVVSGWPT